MQGSKIRYWPPLLLAVFFLLIGCIDVQQDDPESINDQALAKLSQAADPDGLKGPLSLTERAIAIDPEYLPAHQTRLNILLELGRYDEAQDQAHTLVAINPTDENRLIACMIREVSSESVNTPTNCYEDLKSRIARNDSDFRGNETYLMALKLSDSPDFDKTAKRHIESLAPGPPQDIARFTLLESSREELLDQILYRKTEP